MSATLQMLNGDAAGKVFSLTAAVSRIGRHPDCEVKLDLAIASRYHAKVTQERGQHLVEDLGSRNGTLVNGQALAADERRPLADGDQVKICDLTLVFRASAAARAAAAAEEPEEAVPATVVTTIQASTPGTAFKANAEAKLRAMLEISAALGSEFDIEKLFPRLLEGIFKVFPQADRALLLVRDGDRLAPQAWKHRRANDDDLRFSRTIARQALEKKEAVLSADAMSDARFNLATSLADMRIRSVMCAPLCVEGRDALGVLQVDTKNAMRRFEADDLAMLLAVAAPAALALENATLHVSALAKERVERELALARSVQRSFLPRSLPGIAGMSFFAFYEAQGQVGGDYYDFVHLPGGRLAALLGDVSGKGVPAALLMAKASSDAKVALLTGGDDPAGAMGRINASVCAAGLEDKFLTLAMCIVDPANGAVRIVNAGHMSPLVRRADGSLEEPAHPDVSGPPIGIVEDYGFEVCDAALRPGDLAVLYTDGISEAMTAAGEEFGMARLNAAVAGAAGNPEAVGEAVLAAVRRHVAGHKQHDDMAIVIFGLNPA